MSSRLPFSILNPEEAAELIPDGAMVAFSGFTPAGAAKAVPPALAGKARTLHQAGLPYKLRVLTGASTGTTIDDVLAEAEAISWRAPFQSSRVLRNQINAGKVEFVDMHLSHLPQSVLFGFFGKIDFAVIEATEITHDGRVYLTTSIGASPTFLQTADKVIIEINRRQSPRISEMADIIIPEPPPYRMSLDLDHPLERIGKTFARVDPGRVVGIVETDEPDETAELAVGGESCKAIAGHVVKFLTNELASGRMPYEFLPLQSGVGNVANAVLQGIGESSDIPNFVMYSEVLQPAAFEMIASGRCRGASTCGLVLTPEQMHQLESDFTYLRGGWCCGRKRYPTIQRSFGNLELFP